MWNNSIRAYARKLTHNMQHALNGVYTVLVNDPKPEWRKKFERRVFRWLNVEYENTTNKGRKRIHVGSNKNLNRRFMVCIEDNSYASFANNL